ncbi:MAG: glycosyltransferase family 2 protein [Planctomycetaceae bacterium]
MHPGSPSTHALESPDSGRPEVSVVMSVYNGARYLRESVDSILTQEGVDFEFIIIDDGSTDESPQILDEYAAHDPRVRVIHQENTGLTRALIRVCAEARGEFVARQDADEVSQQNRLLLQVELLRRDSRLGLVSCTTQYVGPAGEPLSTLSRPEDPEQATLGLLHDREGPPAHGSVMFRRSLYEQVGGYRPEFYFGQDSDLWLRMAERSLIGYRRECLVSTPRSATSLSGAYADAQKRFGELGQQCREARSTGRSEEPLLAEARVLRDAIASRRNSSGAARGTAGSAMNYLLGSQLLRNGDRRARRYLLATIRRSPWHWRAWVRLAQSLLLRRGAVPVINLDD